MRKISVIICFIFLFMFCGCVPGRKFSRISDAYDKCRADSIVLADSASSLTRQKGELILKNIALRQDSIKKEKKIADLKNQYDRLLSSGSSEMAEVIRQMRETQEETRRISDSKSDALIYQSEISKTLSTIGNELNIGLYGIDDSKVKVTTNRLSVVISIESSYMFTASTLAVSPEGERVINAVTRVLENRNLFNVHVIKYAPVEKVLARMEDKKTVTALAKINELQTGINRYDNEIAAARKEMETINAEQAYLFSQDSSLTFKRDSLLIERYNADEIVKLMKTRQSENYGSPAQDSIAVSNAIIRYSFVDKEIENVDTTLTRCARKRNDNELRIKIVQDNIDGLEQQRNMEIASIYRIMHSIADVFHDINIEEISIASAYLIKECGKNLGHNRIIAEQMFLSQEDMRSYSKRIDIVIKPDIDSIIKSQKNHNRYD